MRGIEVEEIRGTPHKEGTFPIKIGETGLVVYPSGKIPQVA